jgi:hypothetical protein
VGVSVLISPTPAGLVPIFFRRPTRCGRSVPPSWDAIPLAPSLPCPCSDRLPSRYKSNLYAGISRHAHVTGHGRRVCTAPGHVGKGASVGGIRAFWWRSQERACDVDQ